MRENKRMEEKKELRQEPGNEGRMEERIYVFL